MSTYSMLQRWGCLAYPYAFGIESVDSRGICKVVFIVVVLIRRYVPPGASPNDGGLGSACQRASCIGTPRLRAVLKFR